MFTTRRFVVAFCLSGCFLLAPQTPVYAQCPNQMCGLSGKCYQCDPGGGQGCSIPVGDCSECTSWTCFAGGRTNESPEFRGVNSTGTSKHWLEACRASASLYPAAGFSESLPEGQIAVTPRRSQLHGPAALKTATFGISDLFLRGTLVNRGQKSIVAYRIGWVYLYSVGKSEIVLGNWTNVPEGIKPESEHRVPAQGASPEPLGKGARLVQFFIAELKYDDGRTWKEDLREIKKIALPGSPASHKSAS